MAMRLIAATGRRLATLALLAALCACATTFAAPGTETRPPGWRIVERTGEARYSPPGTAAWRAVITGQALADGSEVATGRGGRLIVGAPGRHISAGPDSRFVLPDLDWDHRLDQRAGWLRYRIAEAGARPFRIHTRSLELELSTGVVDVHVDHLATEVTVKEGQVRVATPDGLRHTQMMAGQSAHSGGAGSTALAVRLAPGEALQPVEPVIVPAIHPERPPAETPAGVPAPAEPEALRPVEPVIIPAIHPEPRPTETPAGVPAPAERPSMNLGGPSEQSVPDRAPRLPAVPQAANDAVPAEAVVRPTPRPVAEPSERPAKAELDQNDADPAIIARTAERDVVGPGAADPAVETIEPISEQPDAAAIRRSKFQRLTAGMIEGVQPPGADRRPIR